MKKKHVEGSIISYPIVFWCSVPRPVNNRSLLPDERGRVSLLPLRQQRDLRGRCGGLPVHLPAGLQRGQLSD